MPKPNDMPAFPSEYWDSLSATEKNHPGMTLRDWFAGQVISGNINDSPDYDSDCRAIAELAYKIADAMLKAREEGNND